MGRQWFNWVLSIALVWWWVLLVSSKNGGVEGYPDEDLVVRLPGQPKVGFNQYAGYVDVGIRNGRSLFYYFVEADAEPEKKPLTLWLNGGPGCSSIGGGAFTELGPFYPRGDSQGLRRNKMSWNRVSNLLFVESPVGVGWSYSNTSSDYTRDDASTAMDMYTFMLKWYEKFPELKSRELFLSGESYADHNARSTGFKFNIKGVAIGNPLLRFDNDIPAVFEYYWSHGMISDEVILTIVNECKSSDILTSANSKCENAIAEARATVGSHIDIYNVILDVCNPSVIEQELRLKKMGTKTSLGVNSCMKYESIFYLNIPEVQKALHANRTKLPYAWSHCSHILRYNQTNMRISILLWLKKIIRNRLPIWVFSGDQDSVVPLLGSRTIVRELAHDLNFEVTIPYGAWFHKGQVGGWATEYGNLLTFATVRGAGHMVPYTQPSRALHLFSSFVNGQSLVNNTCPSIDP